MRSATYPESFSAMGAARKLQTEIDRTLKKVQEGVDTFDQIWKKVGLLCVGAFLRSPLVSFHVRDKNGCLVLTLVCSLIR